MVINMYNEEELLHYGVLGMTKRFRGQMPELLGLVISSMKK